MPEGFAKEKYDAFAAALKKNGATDMTDKKVMEFVIEHVEDWKS